MNSSDSTPSPIPAPSIKFDFIVSLVFIVVRCLVFLLRRMEHIFSHVYGFDCVRCPTRIGIEHDWRHLFRYQRRPLRYADMLGSLSNSGAAANGDSGNGRVMLIDGTSVIHRAYYKLLEDSLLHLDFVQSTRVIVPNEGFKIKEGWNIMLDQYIMIQLFTVNRIYSVLQYFHMYFWLSRGCKQFTSIWRSQIVVEKIDAKLLNQQ
ncbi:hypothetical protein P8452_50706 [Trifolium repens]|nr:hypothetical protein P8452_50706 [Trifolium repens]